MKQNETNVFQLCCVQRAYVGYVGWKNLENYVEMVAGLPRNEQKMKIFCKSNKRLYGVYKHIVVLSSDNVGVFCLPNSTESEKNFYVIRDQKALESVQNYRSVMTS